MTAIPRGIPAEACASAVQDPARDIDDPGPHQEVYERLIAARVAAEGERIARQFAATRARGCGVATVDNLLPRDLLDLVRASLPAKRAMIRRKSLGEQKYCLAQTEGMPAALRTCIAAFASPSVASRLGALCGLGKLAPDAVLYNGGVTVMAPGDFMRPHLDNSHNRDRSHQRRLAALFYLTATWRSERGGALKIWAREPLEVLETIEYRSNRLVLMEVCEDAWHSVGLISGDLDRVNLTTYFYDVAETRQPVRLTRFTGWPDEPMVAAMLEGRYRLRMAANRLGAGRLARNPHVDTLPQNPAGRD